jgi:hypothetical protein
MYVHVYCVAIHARPKPLYFLLRGQFCYLSDELPESRPPSLTPKTGPVSARSDMDTDGSDACASIGNVLAEPVIMEPDRLQSCDADKTKEGLSSSVFQSSSCQRGTITGSYIQGVPE